MIKTLITRDTYALFALLLSGGLLCGAWFFQYGLGYAPCTMCYWQRHAHKIVLGVAALTLIYGRLSAGESKTGINLLNVAVILALLGSAFMALWHAGVELGIFEELKICSTGGTPSVDGMNGQDLINSLSKKTKPPACSDVAWSFLGVSMAGWNAIASLSGAAIGALAFDRKKS